MINLPQNTMHSTKTRHEFLTLLLLLVSILATSLIGFNRGMNWSDAAQIFYFGNRIVHGEFPYRDFPYQTGFIPLFVEAVFQHVFGELYVSSLFVGLLVKVTTIGLVYIILRQFTNKLISFNISLGLSLMQTELISSGNNTWVRLFIVMSILFTVLAFHRDRVNKATKIYTIGLGLIISFIVFTRQSDGVLCTLLLLLISLVYSFKDPKKYMQNLTICVSIGLMLGFSVMLSFLNYNQAIRQSFYELFIAGSERKNFNGVSALLDAFSGGALYSDSFKNMVIKMFLFNVIPTLVTLTIFMLIVFFSYSNLNAKKRYFYISLSILSIPTLAIMGILIESFNIFNLQYKNYSLSKMISEIMVYDIPRVFFSVVLIIALIFPEKILRLFGFLPVIFSVSVALTLGKIWASQISWLGRNYIETSLLIFLVMLMITMSSQISVGKKKLLSTVFLLAAFSIFSYQILSNSLVQEKGSQDINYSLNHPMTRFIKVSKEKETTFSMLRDNIKPGHSCFIYGSAPILYTLLECDNPTNLPLTYSDALTLSMAHQAVDELKVNPPEWIIETGQLPYLDEKTKNSNRFYTFFNQPGPQTLRKGLQSIMKDYELITTAKEQLSDVEVVETYNLDYITKYRLFRRKY